MSLTIVQILGVKINGTSASSVLGEIVDFVTNPALPTGRQASKGKLVIFTPNPEFLVEAQKDKSFKEVLNMADINIPDGIGLVWASRFLGNPVKERVSGADLVEKLLKVGNGYKWTVGVIGARKGDEGETGELIEKLGEKYPNITFVNLDLICHSGLVYTVTAVTCDPESIQIGNYVDSRLRGNDGNVDPKFIIILACHGMVRQEKWIMENKDKIDAKVFMGIGGSLDFLTGFTKRAPLWMRSLDLEWLWRGLQKPGHWKRILTAVIIFPWMVLKEKLNSFLR